MISRIARSFSAAKAASVGVVLAAAAIAAGAFAPPAARAGADDPLHRLAAASGCGAWSHLRTLRFTGRQSGDGLSGPETETLDTRSGAFVDRWRNGVFPSASGYDGRTGWAVDRSGVAHAMNAPFAVALARTDAWVATRGWCAADRGGAHVVAIAHPREGGATDEIVTVAVRNGATIQLSLDEHGRLVRTFEQQTESRLSTRYAAFADVAGVAVPLRVERTDLTTGGVFTSAWSRVVPLAGRPRASYAEPAAPNDRTRLLRAAAIPAHFEGPKIFVDATVNGRGPFPLILDTGGHFILTPAAASVLRLAGRGRALGTGAGPGVVAARFAKVRTLRFGDAVLRDQTVRIRPLHYDRSFRGPRPPVAGVIGIELFERYAVTIDPHAKTVVLSEPMRAPSASMPGGSRRVRPRAAALPLLFVEDAPLIDGAVDGRRGLIEVDTGNGGPAIVEPVFARRTGIAARFARGPRSGGTGAGGAFSSSLGRVTLRLGPFTLRGEAAELVRDAVGAEATVSTAANAGPSVLAHFVSTFEYARGVLVLAPIARRDAGPAGRDRDDPRENVARNASRHRGAWAFRGAARRRPCGDGDRLGRRDPCGAPRHRRRRAARRRARRRHPHHRGRLGWDAHGLRAAHRGAGAAQRAGRHAERRFERAREMTLIGEAAVRGGFGDRTSRGEETIGGAQAHASRVRADGDAEAAFERARDVRGIATGFGRERAQRELAVASTRCEPRAKRVEPRGRSAAASHDGVEQFAARALERERGDGVGLIARELRTDRSSEPLDRRRAHQCEIVPRGQRPVRTHHRDAGQHGVVAIFVHDVRRPDDRRAGFDGERAARAGLEPAAERDDEARAAMRVPSRGASRDVERALHAERTRANDARAVRRAAAAAGQFRSSTVPAQRSPLHAAGMKRAASRRARN